MRELLTTARNDSIAPLSLIQYFPDNPLLGEPSPKDQSIVNVDDDVDQHQVQMIGERKQEKVSICRGHRAAIT